MSKVSVKALWGSMVTLEKIVGTQITPQDTREPGLAQDVPFDSQSPRRTSCSFFDFQPILGSLIKIGCDCRESHVDEYEVRGGRKLEGLNPGRS
jgi:hypothetical protein